MNSETNYRIIVSKAEIIEAIRAHFGSHLVVAGMPAKTTDIVMTADGTHINLKWTRPRTEWTS